MLSLSTVTRKLVSKATLSVTEKLARAKFPIRLAACEVLVLRENMLRMRRDLQERVSSPARGLRGGL
jgi:hypothetical protein